MDDVALVEEFKRICFAAARIDREADSVIEFEPQLVQLLTIARQMSRNVAVRCFVAVTHGDIEAPVETVPFCMHSFRFPEVRDEASRLVGEPPDPRRMSYGSNVIHAYDDDWKDKDMWSYYRDPT